MEMVFIYECKSCEISNEMFSLCFYFWRQTTNWLWHKYCKIELFSGAISHGASKAPKEHLEPSKTSVKVSCCENCKQLKKAVNYFRKKKKPIVDVRLGSKKCFNEHNFTVNNF